MAGVGRAHDFDFDNEKGKPMNESTKESYRKLAANFYKTRLSGQPTSAKRIADALKNCAGEYRPAYWRRLRNALEFDQRDKGYLEAADRIKTVKNPITKAGDAVKPKQSRTRRIKPDDEKKLLDHLMKVGDRETYSAIQIAKITGARPAEFGKMFVQGNIIYIEGAKKSHAGSRGADRCIEVSQADAMLVDAALKRIPDDIGPIQDKVRAAGKKLWPQRKSVPSLYSWRHQLGSELKASGLDRKIIAYLMGHQSTASVDQYGNPKMAVGGKVLPKPAEGVELDDIRVRHSQPPSQTVEKAENTRENRSSKWSHDDSPKLG